MEFIRNDVHTSLLKALKYSQVTIDEDFNISDSKSDIEKIISKEGMVLVDELICQDNKVKLIGEVRFKILYKASAAKHGMEVFQGSISFEDVVNVDNASRSDYSECRCKLEDLSVSVINSRKINVRGLLGNAISVYESSVCNVAVGLENADGVECQYIRPVITESVISKHDVAKIREEISIPQNKPNIDEIIWASVDTRNMEIKPLTDKLALRGEVEIFVMYRGGEEHLPVQNLYCVRNISMEVECQGADEEMILDADFALGKGDVVIKADEDGEDRVLGVDYNLDMNLKLYQDKEINMLSDMYSPQLEFNREQKNFAYENLILRNQAKLKINYRKNIPAEDGRIMQICHIYGNTFVENTETTPEGVIIEGIVKVNILYVSQGEEPLSCIEENIPYQYMVEAGKLSKEASIRVVPCLDQLSANLISGDEIEIKGQVCLGISIFKQVEIKVMEDVAVNEIDYEKKAAVPGIVGYVVNPGDTLWSIARKYYATTESIKDINNLETDEVYPGDRLIIVKA